MSTTASSELMTTEELLALPDDGVERWLIEGRLIERPVLEPEVLGGWPRKTAITRRNRRHSRVEANVAYLLGHWLRQQPGPRGEILDGEAGFRLRRNPDTTVGIDVAYIAVDLAARTPEDARLVDGVPVLAVEILSPNDAQDDITAKVRQYLTCGVDLVWVVEPVFRTVTVYRAGAEPEMFSVQQELTGDPHLPGFRIHVADIFS